MGVAGERQRDARPAPAVKISGSCASRMTGSSVLTRCERAGQIVDAAEAARAEPIARAGRRARPARSGWPATPSSTASFSSSGMRAVRKRAAHAVDVVPPVVIAEDRIDAERRAQARQARPPRPVRRHSFGDETMGGEIIAEHHDEIAVERIGGIDHLAHAREPHIGAAGVQVGDDRDGQALAVGPARRRQAGNR